MPKSQDKETRKNPVGRRGFLKGAAAGAAALVANPGGAEGPGCAEQGRTTTGLPSARLAAAESAPPPPRVDVYTTDRPGSDFMVDVIKSLGFDYVCANPGSSFRGLHESLVNYGHNKSPELLTCCHEESSVAMAHGYAKIEGKPLMIMAHGTVGLQHASMAIYNAFADRVPVYIVLGNIADVGWRRGDVEWAHSVQDAAAMVRDYTKFDDAPVSLGHFAESAVRAYKIMMTPPMEPVVIVADAVLQEEPMSEADRRTARIPKLTLNAPPAGRFGGGGGSGPYAGGGGGSGYYRGPRGANSGWPQTAGGIGGVAAGAGAGPAVPDELPFEPSSVWRREYRAGGRDPWAGSSRFLDR